MKNRIKILPDHLINQIAAGEVVERPASVVKELVENAIDAEASRIEIHIKDAGKTEIQIVDNGIGMSKEDAGLAFTRHATSKIEKLDDLTNIQTLGFRGEALASIGAVAKVTLETKLQGSQTGTKITCIGEKITKIEDHGCPEGTSITVQDIFFNIPARKKYLKSDATELNHITSLATEIALAYHDIHFHLTHNGRTIFNLPKSDDHMVRIRGLLGKDISDHLIPIFYGGQELKIEGLIGKPEIARTTRLHQYLFINKRAIKNNTLAYAISEGFHSLLPQGKYPVFIMNIEIKPELIDVNVHPRKLEIRFQNQAVVFNIVKKATRSTLESNILAPKIQWQGESLEQAQEEVGFDTQSSRRIHASSQPKSIMYNEAEAFSTHGNTGREHKNVNEKNFKQALEFSQEFSKGIKSFDGDASVPMIPIAQVAASYIIAKDEEGIVIIDQHAAHERYMYEQLMNALLEKNSVSQALLVPLSLNLSHHEAQIVKENKEILKQIGFEIEHFSGNTFNVMAIPSCLNQEGIHELMMDVISDLLEEEAGKTIEQKQEKVLTSMACKSAIKFGRPLSLEEQIELIRQMNALKQKFTCPHGRPTMIRLSFTELEKRFKRR